MKYFWLGAQDTGSYMYVFRVVDAEDILVVRPEFRVLACGECGKFDEFAAIRLGIFNSRKSRSMVDFQASGDHLPIVSDRFIAVCREASITGVEFVPFRETVGGMLSIMLPLAYATVDVARSGYRGTSLCSSCTRWLEYKGFPCLESMVLHGQEPVIRHPSVFNQSIWGKHFLFFVSESTRDILKSAKLKGLSFHSV